VILSRAKMKLPSHLKDEAEELEFIVQRWPVKVPFDHVLRWVLQFDSADHSLAVRVLRHLNVVGSSDLDLALQVAYSKLRRKAADRGSHISHKNTLFAGIGSAAKSGAMMAYHLRLIGEISEENFLGEEVEEQVWELGLIKNVVFVDDFVSTGMQATKAINDAVAHLLPAGVVNRFFLTACGFIDGISEVERKTETITFAALEYSQLDTVSSLDSLFYEGVPHADRNKTLERLRHYGSACYRKNPLGWGGLGGLVVFYYNTPNSTLPIIWSDGNGWLPLFKRVRRIGGINAYISGLKKQAKARVEKKEIGEFQIAELTVFVEGVTDELIMDFFIRERQLASALGFERVYPVALGGANALRSRMMKRLQETTPKGIVVVDGDAYTRRIVEKREPFNALPIVFLRPSWMALLRLEDLLAARSADDRLEPVRAALRESGMNDSVWSLLERIYLRDLSLQHRQDQLQWLFSSFLDERKYDAFVSELKEVAWAKGS